MQNRTFLTLSRLSVLFALLIPATPAAAVDWAESHATVDVPGVSFALPVHDVVGRPLSLSVEYKDTAGDSHTATSVCSVRVNSGVAEFMCSGLEPTELTAEMVYAVDGTAYFSVPLLGIADWEIRTGNEFIAVSPGQGDVTTHVTWEPVYIAWVFFAGWECVLEPADHTACDNQCHPYSGTATVEEKISSAGTGGALLKPYCTVTCECGDGSVSKTDVAPPTTQTAY